MVRIITNNEVQKSENNEVLDGKDIYDKEGVEQMTEDGEIEGWEAGFMQGATGEGQGAKCRYCGEIFADDNVIEKEIDGENYRFCSDEHVEKYIEKQKKKSQSFYKDYKR